MIERGPAAITFRGRTIVREQGFVSLREIVCPDGHRMKAGNFTARGGDIALTCTNKAVAGANECGALIWMALLVLNRHDAFVYAADVEYRELRAWEEGQFSAEDVFQYLGAWFTRERAFRRPLR